MPRRLTTILVVPIAAAALSLAVSGCGGSRTSTTSSPASSATATATASSAAAGATAGSLAAACPEIDAVMNADPDSDATGTARKLAAIKAKVTGPDADLIGALEAAYQTAADNANIPGDSPEATKITDAVTNTAKALGTACRSTSTTAHAN